MDVRAASKLQKILSSELKLKGKYGPKMAKAVMKRITQLEAADTLEDMRSLPGNWHELHEDRDGQIAANLSANLRLIIKPANNPLPLDDDGGLDWSSVDSVNIVEIADYH